MSDENKKAGSTADELLELLKKSKIVKATSREQIGRSGKFKGGSRNFVLNKESFENWKSNFENGVYGSQPSIGLAFDAEHMKERGALGWIKGISVGKDIAGRDAAFADVEWTNLGVNLIRDERFKYVSPTFYPTYADPETGKKTKDVLAGAALTVDPFLTGMQPVEYGRLEIKTLESHHDIAAFMLSLSEESKFHADENVVMCSKMDLIEEVIEEMSDKKVDLNKTDTSALEAEIENLRLQLSKSTAEVEKTKTAAEEKEAEIKKAQEKLLEEKNARLAKEQELNAAKEELSKEKASSVEKDVKIKLGKYFSSDMGSRVFKPDFRSKVEEFAIKLRKADEGLIQLSKEDTGSAYDEFFSIMDGIQVEKATELSKEIGHGKSDESSMQSEGSADGIFKLARSSDGLRNYDANKEIEMANKGNEMVIALMSKHNISFDKAFDMLLEQHKLSS